MEMLIILLLFVQGISDTDDFQVFFFSDGIDDIENLVCWMKNIAENVFTLFQTTNTIYHCLIMDWITQKDRIQDMLNIKRETFTGKSHAEILSS
jgi:hypothetical protein